MLLVRQSLLLFFLLMVPPVFSGGRVTDRAPRRPAYPSIMIMDRGIKSPSTLISFMLDNNNNLDSAYLVRLIRTYIIESKREGVNHDVAVCQMCLETGFLRFTGSVSRFQNNFCGLGAINAYTAGDWFDSMEEGVRAHIQHLKAYASVDPLQSPPVDKRLEHVHRGTVFTIYDLAGTWAADPDYGYKIDQLLKKLFAN
ncbi:MAG: glucosaminidase domain-containing protein [Bacteroidales bacterium]|nr:glucosaminidase domain-containing protein [Bacteroidales bacterium]